MSESFGPWYVEKDIPQHRTIVNHAWGQIVAVISGCQERDVQIAHLFAAAPDLLEALEALVKLTDVEDHTYQALARADAAIAKARNINP